MQKALSHTHQQTHQYTLEARYAPRSHGVDVEGNLLFQLISLRLLYARESAISFLFSTYAYKDFFLYPGVP